MKIVTSLIIFYNIFNISWVDKDGMRISLLFLGTTFHEDACILLAFYLVIKFQLANK